MNTPSTQGAVGITTELAPSFTLGCGTVGGSSTSDNVGPQHLFNVRYVAYDTGKCPVEGPVYGSCRTPAVADAPDVQAQVKQITEMVIAQLSKM